MGDPIRRRLVQRYAQRLRPERSALDCLVDALQTLLQTTSKKDSFFLGHGLDLLVSRLGADLAYLVVIEGGGFQTRWWSPEKTISAPKPVLNFCQWLMDFPHRTLVLGDLGQMERLKHDAEVQALSIGAAAGATLWRDGRVSGLVFIHYAKPHAFSRPELALLNAVAGFLARVLEVEELKSSLRNLETALDITRAVVEDSSIQDVQTDLPNLRYLDIWLKANLDSMPGKEVMTVAEWSLIPENSNNLDRVRQVAEWVRGGDLLIAEGHGRFLVLLQRTSEQKGEPFLRRLQKHLGPVPMGATVWVPGEDDPNLESVRKRLGMALEISQGLASPDVVWQHR